MMDPLAMGLLAASILAALGTASWAALKGWQGWLELRRFELTHGRRESTAAGYRPHRDRRPARARPQIGSDRRRHRYLGKPPASSPARRG